MSGSRPTVGIRISAEGAEQVKRQLEALGPAGERAFQTIQAASRNAQPEFQKLGTSVDVVQRAFIGMGGSLGSVGSVFTGVSAVAGGLTTAIVALGAAAATSAVAIAKAGDEATATMARLASSTGGVAQATQVYEQLFKLSQQTGVAVAESAGSFSRFAVAAKEIGGTNAQVVQLVAGIQKAGIVAGASAAETGAAVQQLGQALASGKLQGDELRSLLENMPQLAQALAQELGTNIGQLRKMGEEGKLTADVVFPALLRATEKIGAEFDKMPVTMSRAKDILIAATEDFGARLDRITGLSQTFARFMQAGAAALGAAGRYIAPSEREAADQGVAAAERQRANVARQVAAERAASAYGDVSPALQQALDIADNDLREALARQAEIRRQDREMQRAEAADAAQQARDAGRLQATLSLKDLVADLDARAKARAKYAETIKKLDDAEAKGGDLPAGVTYASLRAAASRELADALEKAAKEEAKAGEEARKAAEKRQDVIDKLNEQVKAAERSIATTKAGGTASHELSLALEIENKLREAGIPAIEKRTDAEKKAADAIGASVRKLDALKEAQKKADEEAKKLKDYQDKSWNEIAAIGERAMDRLSDAMVQAFVTGKGAAVTFANVAKGILSSIVSDFARLAVVNPIMNSLFVGTNGPRPTLAAGLGGSGLGLGDVLGLSSLIPKDGLLGALGISGTSGWMASANASLFGTAGVSPATASLFMDATGVAASPVAGTSGLLGSGGLASIGGVLGAAGLGFGAGSLVNGLIGGNQTGGMVGSALGTGAGIAAALALDMALPGAGTLLALLGGAAGGGLGGLFGPGPSVQGYGFRLQSAGWGPDATPTNEMASSLLPIDRTFYNESGAQMFAAADQLVAATNAYLAARGLTVGGVSIVGGNKNGADYSWADAGNLNEAFTRLRFGAANDNQLAGALTGRTFSDLGGLQQFVEGFTAVRDTIRNLTETPAQKLARQIEEIGKQFDTLSDKAKEYGISEEGLTAARQKAIDKIKEQSNPEGQNIRSYLDRFNATDATAAPSDRLAAAQKLFATDLAAAQAGDTSALARITSSADTLLNAGRAAYASGPQFAALKSMTFSSLENLPAVRGLPASQQPIDMVPLIDELAQLKGEVASLKEELRTARLRAA